MAEDGTATFARRMQPDPLLIRARSGRVGGRYLNAGHHETAPEVKIRHSAEIEDEPARYNVCDSREPEPPKYKSNK